MIIRAMEEKDLEQVCQIEQDNFSMPWSRQSFLDSIRHPKHLYLVAEHEGRILGYCGMWIVLEEGQINNVAVDRAYRRQGVASAMFEVFLKQGYKMGARRFTLEVRESNQGAIALYERFSFQNVGIRKNFYEKPVEHAVIMWKEN